MSDHPDPRGARPTVLVVEDEDAIRRLARRMLAAEGYQVVTVPHGAAALQVLASTTPDVILSDLQMPHIDGVQLAREVNTRWPTVRMVFMTGHPDLALPPDLPGPLLKKPFTSERLLQAIRQVMISLA